MATPSRTAAPARPERTGSRRPPSSMTVRPQAAAATTPASTVSASATTPEHPAGADLDAAGQDPLRRRAPRPPGRVGRTAAPVELDQQLPDGQRTGHAGVGQPELRDGGRAASPTPDRQRRPPGRAGRSAAPPTPGDRATASWPPTTRYVGNERDGADERRRARAGRRRPGRRPGPCRRPGRRRSRRPASRRAAPSRRRRRAGRCRRSGRLPPGRSARVAGRLRGRRIGRRARCGRRGQTRFPLRRRLVTNRRRSAARPVTSV